ncbi:LysM peptidoglycan-binding domain-containing protein [Arthrobacter sp. ISL-95]|uniref:LysM peptidoglycan-binding domain-containing protein n=1 Tax=Arthrobacter sp. ISL-95 TaxID=2819116 RepID=UPI001BE60121|nr:LysM peptidoglycan-binding domain-containing protein [Arthrobacter sp. ISL-95]MBT2586081.1 LysM peptidoglycan-binding domain-containing protein [Arthrobacter sp. ISL-95]
MVRVLRSDSALAAFILGLGLSLVLAGHVLLAQWQDAERHRQNFTFEHLLGLFASAVGLSVVCWWALTFLIAFLASLLHRIGHRKGADILSKFSPAFMLRLAVAVMSLSILGTGVAQADTSPPEPSWQSASPLNRAPMQVAWTPVSLDRASSALPSVEDPREAASRPSDPRWHPRSPIIDPGLLSRQSTRSTTPPGEVAVVVKDGDSLWSIAASRLGPFATDVDVALTWPKWYSANRALIGSDPAVLRPGQVLQPPAPS